MGKFERFVKIKKCAHKNVQTNVNFYFLKSDNWKNSSSYCFELKKEKYKYYKIYIVWILIKR